MSCDEAWHAVGFDPALAQLGASAGQKLTHAAPSFWLLAAGNTVTAVSRLLSGSAT